MFCILRRVFCFRCGNVFCMYCNVPFYFSAFFVLECIYSWNAVYLVMRVVFYVGCVLCGKLCDIRSCMYCILYFVFNVVSVVRVVLYRACCVLSVAWYVPILIVLCSLHCMYSVYCSPRMV